MKYKITVLCDNYVKRKNLIAEHGWSVCFEDSKSGERILFDTGQGFALVNNLKELNIEIESISKIVLSHGHYDHCGGLMTFLKERKERIPVVLHNECFKKKFAVEADHSYEIGMQYSREEYEKAGADFITFTEEYEINHKIKIYADIQNNPDIFDKRLSIEDEKNNTFIRDPFNDDASLFIKTDLGNSILLGCAHSGVDRIIKYISGMENINNFYGIAGGSHMSKMQDNYVNEVISLLKAYDFKLIALSHCTGIEKASIMKNIFNDQYRMLSVGDIFYL